MSGEIYLARFKIILTKVKSMILKMTKSFCFLITLLVFFITGVVAGEYDHELVDKNFTFAWKVDGENLAVKMSAKTEGWVGIGFNPSEKMMGANFVVGYVKKGKAKLIDDFGTKKNAHKSDKKLGGSEDAVLVAGAEDGGVTTIEFTIPLKSGDKYDADIVADGDNVVLLAYGAGRDSFKAKHKYRSTFKVNLASGTSEKMK